MVKKIKFIFLFIVFLIMGLLDFSLAQTFNFKNYNTENGLPQSQVLSMLQDEDGYIWFGTNSGGVAKFDGNKFYALTTNDGLINDVVFSIVEDKKKRKFFGTDMGLSVYNNFAFKNYNEKDGLSNSTIYNLSIDGEKTWIGTQKGVFIFENDKIQSFDKNELLNTSSVYKILHDSKGNVWFGTFQNGVIHYNRKTQTFTQFTEKEGLCNDFIFSFFERKDGSVLVGTSKGLSMIDNNLKIRNVKEIILNENNSYSSIVELTEDELFFGSFNQGAFSFNFKTNTRSPFYNSVNGLTNSSILSMLKDREGNIWIGTDGAGVFKFFNHKFIYYTKNNGLLDNYINAVAEDKDKRIWVALSGNGLAKIENEIVTSYKTKVFNNKNQLPDNNINTILPTPDGKVYFGTQEGLCYFENEKFYTLTDDLIRKKFISSLFLDSKNNLWIGTNFGVYKMVNNKVEAINKINLLVDEGYEQMIFFIKEDKYGNMYFGTEHGIIVLEKDNVKVHNNTNKFIKTRVGCCVLDSKKNLWLGTSEGLYLYNYSVFTKISKKNGYTSGFINFLEIDKKDNLYIGSNKGIDILNLNDFYKNKVNVKHLGKEDGLLNLESNSNASFIASNGNVLIGTIKGLQIYNPKLENINTKEPNLLITEIKLFYGQEDYKTYSSDIDSSSLLPNNLVLPYNKNNISFKYIGLSLTAPEKVMYQYMLKGLDEKWTPEVSKTEVTYPSLPPGSYTFMVKAMNNDGFWNKESTSYSFKILPPWYNTIWFYTICALSLISGVISYNYFKTKKLKTDKLKLEKTVDERTKELREEKEKVEVINKEVISQKVEIENKNHEITDSIKYAKNIQEALLPSITQAESGFNDCFILYLPKDIVSGDFFWYSHHNNVQYIAAADCTGHGVPGAFMSIVGNNLLNEIINQKNKSNPGEILLDLHQGVKIALNQNRQENERRDGMDIALCAFHKNKNIIEFSGANRPLWIYRKDNNYELDIVKPNKFPIGGLELEENRQYISHTLKVNTGDFVFLFSDGFADQFGGPKGKKFMVSNMQKLLFDNLKYPMSVQKKNINNAFQTWKNNLEQIDDVLLVGIKI